MSRGSKRSCQWLTRSHYGYAQVDSWIPLWAWDVPAKKGKKAKKASGEKSSKKEKASSGVSSALGSVAGSAEGLVQQAGKATGARIEEIADEDA